MHALITGGAGFIGSNLSKALLARGAKVDIVDNLSTGYEKNIPSGARFCRLDISDPDSLLKLPEKKYDAICHLAAQSSGIKSAEDPWYDLQANAGSTLLLSRWALRQGTPRFLHASSMVAYGSPASHCPDETTKDCPTSYYGVSKLASEHLLRLASLEGLSVTCFRMFSVYGPNQDLSNLRQGMASIFLAYILRNELIPVTGSLKRFRDFIYVDDVVNCWIKALEMPSTRKQVYNLGSGIATTVDELIKSLLIASGLPADYPVKELPGNPSDQFGLYADIKNTVEDLNWSPQTKLIEGLEKMIRWARSQQ